MNSTDQNLNNPTRIDPIEIRRMVESAKFMRIEKVTQDFYDHIAIPEPYTCYVISDATDGRVYYGTVKVLPTGSRSKYYVTQVTPNEWILVVNCRDAGPYGGDNLSEVCRYDDLNKAVSAMQLYNRVGSHQTINVEIYNILQQYISGDIDIITCILGFFVVFGYKEDPRLQQLIQITYQLDTLLRQSGLIVDKKSEPKGRDIGAALREELMRWNSAEPTSLPALFNRIYNVFVIYHLFKDPEYHEDPSIVNLSDPVEDIIRAYSSWKYVPTSI